jgi:hypothetical protein
MLETYSLYVIQAPGKDRNMSPTSAPATLTELIGDHVAA